MRKKELIVGVVLVIAIAGTVAYGLGQPEYDMLSRMADTTASPTQEPQTEGSRGMEEEEELETVAAFPEHPEERPEYDPLKYAKACDLSEINVDTPKPDAVTEEEIDKSIRKIFRNKEMWVHTDGPAKKNNMVKISYIGKADGKEVEKRRKQRYLGKGFFQRNLKRRLWDFA